MNLPLLKSQLIFINSNYGFLCDTITHLEGRSTLRNQIDLIDNVCARINAVEGETGAVIKKKLKSVLEKNEGFAIMQNLSKTFTLSSNEEIFPANFTVEEICSFKNAPLTSVDVERSFSLYKTFLRPNRQSFDFNIFKKNFMIYANNALQN